MDVNKMEKDIQKFWKKNRIVHKVRKLRKGKKKYYFLDGPPYATGYIHIGTAWNKILKDIYIRFHRMKGFDVWDQPGYDTHGLPIENKIEKKLGFHSKGDIDKFGIEAFNKECRKFVTEFIDIMNNQFEDLGVWMDWDDPYLTLDNEYIEGAWYTFKVAFDKDFLYKDRYSVHVCPRCQTAVAYNEIEYKKMTDPSVCVKFPVKGKKNEFFLIWTTTPWTLPANTGIMAKPGAEYVYVKIEKETWILAKELVPIVMGKAEITDFKVKKTVQGKDLNEMKYDHPLDDLFTFQKRLKNAHRVVLSDQYVTLDEGTGLVHTAPGHGQEDYKVGKENDLPILCPLKMNGTFDETCGRFAGRLVKSCDDDIKNILKERGLLVYEESITHDYPRCWRCDSPLLFMAVPQWFFRVTKIRNKLIEENKKVNWFPEWAGKRFHNWLESLGDWPISRQRYWGIPLPIWICEKCEESRVIGSTDELPKVPKDLHRPYIDEVELKCKCGGKMKRIPDVLDVWFDAGLAGWASLGYPKKKECFERLWPADLNIEGPDQIRGWWNAELITSVITFGEKPFKNILFHGFNLDAHGAKMSKSRGNIVAPEEVIEKYGRDVLRFYLLSGATWEDQLFDWTEVENVAKILNILRNTFGFVKTYVTSVPKKPKLNVEDRWIISKLNSLILEYEKQFNVFSHHKVIELLEDFILNDFSRWYIKLVRDRTWPLYKGEDKEGAFYALMTVSEGLVKLLAPLCPFIAEQSYQDVVRPLKKGLESVHMYDLPVAEQDLIDKKLEKRMEIAKRIFETVSGIRQTEKIRLRWPVKKVLIQSNDKGVKEAVEGLKNVLLKMCNTYSIEVVSKLPKGSFSEGIFNESSVFVDLEEDKDLYEERLYRELTRTIQEMRKKNKFVVTERIKLTLKSDGDTEKVLKKFVDRMKSGVGATQVKVGKTEGKYRGKLEFRDKKVEIGFEGK